MDLTGAGEMLRYTYRTSSSGTIGGEELVEGRIRGRELVDAETFVKAGLPKDISALLVRTDPADPSAEMASAAPSGAGDKTGRGKKACGGPF